MLLVYICHPHKCNLCDMKEILNYVNMSKINLSRSAYVICI